MQRCVLSFLQEEHPSLNKATALGVGGVENLLGFMHHLPCSIVITCYIYLSIQDGYKF